ncbi:hypothetical protein HN020_07205 [Brevibacillus borstelensis]|uniref:hypothetical protein n=1 Tax=Brevibacillus borstelensis TaxID=45462 RepID=UPI00148F61D8|nr:hypothetical protein [Brevibacillus borstelensis]NOU54540.1 hypothetical protein [Brevibacillus borstelensis]
MSNPVPVYKSLKVTELLVNPLNPRFNAREHQSETIHAMVQDQKEKLVSLARHIVENGLNPTDLILVKPNGNNQWVVREGNRRITSLKLLNEPSLVPSDYPKLKKDFQQLNSLMDNLILQRIPCVILEDENKINEWVRLKHTGQNDGAGTVGWDGQQTSRFKELVEGKADMRIAFLDFLREQSDLSEELKTKLYNIKKTNFDRLMGDPDVRSFLGLSVENSKLELVNGINRYLLMVLEDLTHDKLSVGKIYYKEHRKEYIEELKRRASIKKTDNLTNITQTPATAAQVAPATGTEVAPATGTEVAPATGTEVAPATGTEVTPATGAEVTPTTDAEVTPAASGVVTSATGAEVTAAEEGSYVTPINQGEGIQQVFHNFKDEGKRTTVNSTPIHVTQGPKKGLSYPIYRKTLVPNIHKLSIKHARILKIFNELKMINIDEFPNASAVLFRTFMELCADYYIEQNGLINGKINVDSSLGVKIDAITLHMKEKKIMTDHQLRPIRQMTSSLTQNQSIKTFHAYVHNKDVTPTATDLKTAWDDVWPFIEKMWS